jgi:hypothetical protein
VAVKEQVTRVLLERLIVNPPIHGDCSSPSSRLIKNQALVLDISTLPLRQEIEKVFEGRPILHAALVQRLWGEEQ